MLDHFFIFGDLPANAEAGHYTDLLVFVSYLVAAAGAFTSLVMASLIVNTNDVWQKRLSHWVGAFALGSGVWSMHFIGMLAYRMTVVHQYDAWLTALSMLIAVFAGYGVLQVTRINQFSFKGVAAGSFLLGICICAMHYTGMAAMDMRADIRYIPSLFLLSIIIAVATSAAAMTIIFYLHRLKTEWQITGRVVAAIVMGAAICGMHYTGVAAMVVIPLPDCIHNSAQSFDALMSAVLAITSVVFILALTVAFWLNHRRNLQVMEEKVKSRTAELENTMKQLTKANLVIEASAQQLQENLDKAEAANKAKSDFLANMSHELRTPLNGMLGMAHLMADTNLSPDQIDLLSVINSSGESLLMLLNDILDFSKIEAGALELENVPFALDDLIHSTTTLLRTNATKKNIELIADYDELPLCIRGDSGRLRQVITNLLGNAIKFTDKGHVRLQAKTIEHDGVHRLMVCVEDTGIGIPADKLTTIFDKFTQADASVTRKFGGTGSGLAISKQLVTLMGGEIGVESVVGKGSTFWFTIPYVEAAISDVEKIVVKTENRKHMNHTRKPISEVKALLVEDHYINRAFAEKLLRKFGFTQIDYAENGAQALLKYRSNIYDVIFMDCQMPEVDGYQATEKIRMIEADTGMHTLIIAMTANAMMGDREKCLKAGMDDYLSKPLRAHHLKTMLLELFIVDTKMANIEALATSKPSATLDVPVEKSSMNIEQLRLFCEGDLEEEKSLSRMYFDQAKEMIAILENSISIDKQEQWKSAAHRLKGSSGNFGAVKLHHLCKSAENNSAEAEVKKIELLTAINSALGQVQTYMEKLHSERYH